MIAPLSPADVLADSRVWDVLVIGAGPAGSSAALQAARTGRSVLLVDAKRFPRFKVCGGCVNDRALACLQLLGLGHVPQSLGAVPLEEYHLVLGGRELRVPMPYGVAVSREALDAALLEAATTAGACFLPETKATVTPRTVDDYRHVQLQCGTNQGQLAARVVLCADGIQRSSLKQLPQFATQIDPHARIGVSAIVDEPLPQHPPGWLTMAVADEGYVGLTRLEGNQLNIAAALDPAALHHGQSIGDVVTRMLRQAQVELPSALAAVAWHGTVPLTSRPAHVAGERLFLLGDAAGYVEPFTGEGIAWALEGALAVTELADAAVRRWEPALATRWAQRHAELVNRRQRLCRTVASVLSRPSLAAAAFTCCRLFPRSATWLMRSINRDIKVHG